MAQTETGQNAVWNYLKTGYALPFRVFAFFMGYFIRNRNRLKAFMAQPRVATAFAIAIAVTMMVWIGIGLYASEEDRSLLTEAVKEAWQETQDLKAEKQRLDAVREQGAAQ